MKVLDLRCSNDHRFEGWFASEDDYVSQTGRGLVDCPLCGDHAITRLPSAPRLNVFKARERGGASPSASPSASSLAVGRRGRDGSGRAMPLSATHSMALASQVETSPSHPDANGAMTVSDMQAGWMHAMRHVLAHTEDVGSRFAEEARRIHHGESEERAIRGLASQEDAEALREEGIEVVAMLVPDALKGSLQ